MPPIITGSSNTSRSRMHLKLTGLEDIRRKASRLMRRSPIVIQDALRDTAVDILEPHFLYRIRRGPVDYPAIYKMRMIRNIGTRSGPISQSRQRVSIDTGVMNHPHVWYAYWIEKGGPPRIESVIALARWVENKWNQPPDMAYTIARNLQKRIMKHGTRPQPFIVPVFKIRKARYVTDVVRRIRTALLQP